MEAHRWVGRGHVTQIGLPPIPICSLRNPSRSKKEREGRQLGKGERKEEGGVSKGEKGLELFFLSLERVFF